MKPFTDKDLNTLKQQIERHHTCPEETCLGKSIEASICCSLIARLEAAEKAARWFNMLNVEPKDSEPYRDYLSWCKSKGDLGEGEKKWN